MGVYVGIVLSVIILALAYVLFNYIKIEKMDEGNAEMKEMAGIIRSGASTFMKTEYKTITIVVAIVAIVFSLVVEKTSGLTLILGALMSSIACVVGMKSATYANVRTAARAKDTLSIGQTVKVALRGGSISGLCVQALGMAGLILILIIWGVDSTSVSSGFLFNLKCNPTTMRVTTYSLGCSLVAMFNRVAGGNYTKAADISSDILAKIRHDLPEDDSRVPNVIADFIGDNVNDIAGNCSDLLESFVATMAAGILIATTSFSGAPIYDSAKIYPIVLAGGGLLGCVIGLLIAQLKKMKDNPSKELNMATYVSAGLTLLIGLLTSYLLFGKDPSSLPSSWKAGWVTPWIASVLGIISGVAIGMITEYYTSTDYKPTQELASMATEGEAFVVTKGDAIGSRSCLFPILIIAIALIISGILCGTYGIALASLGMLSFVGTTVSIDAFGPIADNAGGLAESCHLDSKVRVITDKLDAVGNTTAAIGKGFAIGSAAFATVSLIVAYVGGYSSGEPVLNFASFLVVAGGILGGALVEYFSALLTDNTIDSAKKMADDGDKLLSIPGVLEGTVKPDYNKMIQTATSEALRKMLFPSILALLIPIIGGIIFGVEFVGGLLVGATIVAIPRAIFMGNSGGAFDNAKKYIEQGSLKGYGKGSAAHKAAVTGDTIGDTRKDVVGVALDIFIKSMSTVANTLSGVIRTISFIK